MSTKTYSPKQVSPELLTTLTNSFGERVKFNEPLAPYLAYRVGGPADVLVFPEDEAELALIQRLAKDASIPLNIVGEGTNLLVVDEGIRGIVVSLKQSFKQIVEVPNLMSRSSHHTWVQCGGGVLKPDLLKWAIARGLKGLEFSAGVPGTIGGGIFMNAGTKYGCYGDILKTLRIYHFDSGPENLSRDQINFGYRSHQAVRDSIVVHATFELTPGDSEAMQKEVDRIILERESKQPLHLPSCGSTFKNPMGENPTGLSAGRLIEKANLKGTRIGGAEISQKHANFILNHGSATATDIIKLIQLVQKEVKRLFGVELEREVIILGGNSRGETEPKED